MAADKIEQIGMRDKKGKATRKGKKKKKKKRKGEKKEEWGRQGKKKEQEDLKWMWQKTGRKIEKKKYYVVNSVL